MKITHLIAPKTLVLLALNYVIFKSKPLVCGNRFHSLLFARILLKILTQWRIQGSLKVTYFYVVMSILPISDALLIRLRLSLNHLTAAPVIATEPCNAIFQKMPTQ